MISSPHRSRGAPAVPTPRPQSCGATAALLPGSIVDRCLSDLGAPGFDGRIERCPVGNIEWCEDFRGNAVSGRQAGLEFHRRASSSGHDRYPRGRAQGALTLCLLFTGTMADAETADLQAGGKSPLHGQNHGRLRFTLSAVSLSDRSLSAATATISLARTVASATLTFDCNCYSINHRAEARKRSVSGQHGRRFGAGQSR